MDARGASKLLICASAPGKEEMAPMGGLRRVAQQMGVLDLREEQAVRMAAVSVPLAANRWAEAEGQI